MSYVACLRVFFVEAFCLSHFKVCFVILDTVGIAGTMSDDHTSRNGF